MWYTRPALQAMLWVETPMDGRSILLTEERWGSYFTGVCPGGRRG